jgi:hypothetical protein
MAETNRQRNQQRLLALERHMIKDVVAVDPSQTGGSAGQTTKEARGTARGPVSC